MEVSVSSALPAEPGTGIIAQAKTLKNDRPGGFTKILDGLLKNLKDETPKNLIPGSKEIGKTRIPQKKQAPPKQTKAKQADKGAEKLQAEFPQGRRVKKTAEEGFSQLISQQEKIGEKIEKGKNEKKIETTNQDKPRKIQNPKEKEAAEVSLEIPQDFPEASELQQGKEYALLKTVSDSPLIEQDDKTRKTSAEKTEKTEDRKAVESLSLTWEKNQKAETEKTGKLPEAKPKEKRRLNVEVRDFRSESAVPQGPGQAQSPQAVPEIQAAGSAPSADLSLDLSSGGKSREAAFREADFRPAQAFEDILARELHQNLNGDIVRQAQIILREHGEGTIRLALKPESLGNVKIQLEMTENKITGHIIVESDEALRAFEREIRSLEQAFKESGFAGASLDMSLAGGNRENGADSRRQEMRFFTEQIAAGLYDGTPETAGISDKAGSGLSLVNMLA
jgi:flagellar hook-length control protein FliK